MVVFYIEEALKWYAHVSLKCDVSVSFEDHLISQLYYISFNLFEFNVSYNLEEE